ncbi:GTP:AMP phosphotransferase, mitochondrial [Candida viswanathii]|uniref:GTP:AMP phosphotransferase, mitochondrial n=1 Tax=Candida viswanathii TaxID=5486 RepID=A0A367YIE0_9ASCO|nr:GTP:AMP phosphotransferase, mitochondrial [Candida viswanathii]
MNPLRILLLGAPGSGKEHRHRDKPRNHSGKEAEKYTKNGGLVPDTIMVGLITGQLQQNNWLNHESSWLLDGFPRTVNQASELDRTIRKIANLNLVVELDVDQRVILDRIEARWVHVPSGRIYNLDYNPPKVPFKDDVTGEPLSKREDDTAEVFQKRLDKYNEEIGP